MSIMAFTYFMGLDLAQTTDFTALAILERPRLTAEKPIYSLRHLQRFALGTPYASVVENVAKIAGLMMQRGDTSLTVDQTGVGRPLVEMLRQAPVPCELVPVTITAGNAATEAADGGWHVPKKELVVGLQVLLQDRRLKVARGLPDVKLLIRELLDFGVKITASANETFGALRESDHDDLVLCVALAAWQAERNPPWTEDAFRSGGESLFANMPEGVCTESTFQD
jgi:hypothetical protein